MTALLSLIGEQPIPILLADRALKPARHVLAHSKKTGGVAKHLQALLPHAETLCIADPYALEDIRRLFEQNFVESLTFNLTSGTKPMAWAGYEVARRHSAPLVYLESERKKSVLYRIGFESDGMVQTAETLPGLITTDDYLRAHVDLITSRRTIPNQEGHRFEQAVLNALRGAVDEIKSNVNLQGTVDIDLVVRCENQVGIVEAKLGPHGPKKAIDQLNTAGGREYLGIYTQKFLISDQDWGKFSDLKALAEARQITVIELPGYGRDHTLSIDETNLLRDIILKGLGG